VTDPRPWGEPSSAWWFFGTLRPEYATGFNVQEVEVAEGVRVEVYHDRIGLWSKPGPSAIRGPGEARDVFALVTAAYALVTTAPLEWALDGWVEATDAKLDGSVLGTIIDMRARGISPMEDPPGPRSGAMLISARLALEVRDRPGYRLALRDIYAALLLDRITRPDDTSSRADDAFTYAYRAIVDLARAVSGRATGELTGGDFNLLAERLELEPEELSARKEPLERARHAAAHGDEDDPELLEARANRRSIIDDARMLVAEVFGHEFDLPPGDFLSDPP
jgi:hypothetical protein